MANPLVSNYVGIAVAVIIGLGVTYAIVTNTVSSANLSGTDAVVAGFLGTFVIISILLLIANNMF